MRTSGPEVRLSVVVPAFNEAERISESIAALVAWLDRHVTEFELIVVDDGSQDDTAKRARSCGPLDKGSLRVIAYRPNRGKGFAVATGLRAARGRYVLFTDADLSTPPEEIAGALDLLEHNEVVIGSRARPGAELVVRQTPLREWMGRTFNVFVRLTGLSGVPDTQCGFKAFRSDVLPELLETLRARRFAFDVELLASAQVVGLRIAEQPVAWTNRADSRVRLLRDSLGMLTELLAIAWRSARRRRRIARGLSPDHGGE